MNRCITKVLILLLMLGTVSCSQDRKALSGRYEAVTDTGIIELVLKDTGEGLWSSAGDEISFKWSRKQQELWLHTKNGGVIVAELENGAITVTLPGVGGLHFVRTAE